MGSDLTDDERRDLSLCWYDDLCPTHESILLTVARIKRQAVADALYEIARDLPWTYNQSAGLPDHAARLARWVHERADQIEAGS